MKFESFIPALKEFFLDILGFLIPGYFTIIIIKLYSTLHCCNIINSAERFIFSTNEITLLIAYIIGYFLYSLNFIGDKIRDCMYNKCNKNAKEDEKEKDKWFSNISENSIRNVIEESTELLIVKEKLNVLIGKDLSNFDYRQIRNLAMSYVPEESMKIYTFMFRADLCKSLSSIIFWIPSLLTIFYVCTKDNSCYHLFWIPIFVFVSYVFTITRMRFLSIAQRIPFSMFIAKVNPINKTTPQ